MPVKLLKGSDLVSYISERQARQIRGLIQSKGIQPKLAIINANPENVVIRTYIKYKQERAEELGVELALYEVDQKSAPKTLKELAKDPSTHGIILQLPLQDPSETEELIKLIPPEKDVDNLTGNAEVESATAQAILWLLAGFGIDLKGKQILVIGKGKLVGAPLIKLLKAQNLNLTALDDASSPEDLKEELTTAAIIISATGQPGLIQPEMLHTGQVIIDAGTSESSGIVEGDIDPKVYESSLDIKVTPRIGGLGPLTISSLFENLVQLIDKSTP